ncbi:MAG: class I SAM-dependent methyltransferase [Pseudomonadota bacterium]
MSDTDSAFESEYRKQDEMFVVWSKNLTDQNYDIQFVIEKLRASSKSELRILDVGGGVGAVAKAITDNVPNAHVDVIDISPLARDNFLGAERTNFILDSFLTRDFDVQYDAILMRVLLHHLVDRSEGRTYENQLAALEKTRSLLTDDGAIYVTENFYQPMVMEDATGRIIFEVTNLKSVAGLVYKLGANTAGEGVRFRSWEAWQKMFGARGLSVVDQLKSETWGKNMPVWQRVPLLCKERFQSVVMLQPA